MNAIIHSGLGLVGFVLIALLMSERPRAVRPRDVLGGLLVQIGLAALLLKLPFSRQFFLLLNQAALALQEATTAGTSFVFGYLGGGDLPFAETASGASFILGFQALPLILVVSALSALLFHWRIMQALVGVFSWALRKSFGVGGALGVGAAANIFVGMVEAPLLIRPYLLRLTRSELFAVMTCGLATIAGTMMVLYATVLQPVLPEAMGHILTASLISAPAALTIARVMVPETGQTTAGEVSIDCGDHSAMDAIVRGTLDGIQLLLSIVAMLIVFVALVSLANQLLGLLPDFAGAPVTLERLLGLIMAPLVWLTGIPWSEAREAGMLMGIKTALNEFLAYLKLVNLPEGSLSPRSTVIMIYALCGFANFGSLGIMLGGLGAMAPERKKEIVALGLRALVAGTIATLMTGAVVGLLTTA